MATHSSILAWRIPWTEEPGRLQSMESLRAGHGVAKSWTRLSDFTFSVLCVCTFNVSVYVGLAKKCVRVFPEAVMKKPD